MVEYNYSPDETEEPPLLGVSIFDLLTSAGDLVIFWYLIQGYTVVLLETDTLDEACMYQMAWQMQGIDCVIWGNDYVGYYILGKKR